MSEREPPSEPHDEGPISDHERRIGNLVLLVIFVVLVGIGIWLANGMLDARRADECISSGRRNCSPIQAPPR